MESEKDRLARIFNGPDFHWGNTKGIKKVVLLETFDYKCFYCERELRWDTASRDHLFPKIKGGRSGMENLVLACKRCNKAKGNRVPTQEECERAYAKHVAYKKRQRVIDARIHRHAVTQSGPTVREATPAAQAARVSRNAQSASPSGGHSEGREE